MRSPQAANRSTYRRASAAFRGWLRAHRQNYAQDVQVSVRGFGARASFGIRGVRVYVDGIPATLPDGQGQLTNIDLNSTDRIEVLRGPSRRSTAIPRAASFRPSRTRGGPTHAHLWRDRRQLWPAEAISQDRRRHRRARLRRQVQSVRDQRLPRPQRRGARHRQLEARLEYRPVRQAVFRREHARLAKAQDPSGSRERSTTRIRAASTLQRSNSTPARPSIRPRGRDLAALVQRQNSLQVLVYSAPQRDPVSGDPGRRSGESATSRRRDRLVTRLRRLDVDSDLELRACSRGR